MLDIKAYFRVYPCNSQSLMFKQWGGHLIGMTQVPEAQLAKELDLPFIAIAMVTDYDAWKVDTEPASVAEIIKACFPLLSFCVS